jgi:hypothetical protein
MKTRYLVSTFVSSVAGMFVLSTVAPVAAADLNPAYKAPVPAIAPFNWNGFYLGANVGGAWASNAVDQSNLVKNGNRDFNVTSSGVVGGGQFGYNLVAAPNWLLGVEADVSGADLNGAVTNPDSGVKFNEKIDAFRTVRGRGCSTAPADSPGATIHLPAPKLPRGPTRLRQEMSARTRRPARDGRPVAVSNTALPRTGPRGSNTCIMISVTSPSASPRPTVPFAQSTKVDCPSIRCGSV